MKYFIVKLLDIYMIVIVIRVFMSWVGVSPANPFGEVVYKLTEPVLAPIRNTLPRMGGIDISPLVVFIIYGILVNIILS